MKCKCLYGVVGLAICLLAIGCGSIQEGNSTQKQNTDNQVLDQIAQVSDDKEAENESVDMSNWDDMYFFDFYNKYMYVSPATDNIYLVQMEETQRWDSAMGTMQDLGRLNSDETDDREMFLSVNDYYHDDLIFLDDYGVSLDGITQLVDVPEALKSFIIEGFSEAGTKKENHKYGECGIQDETITKVEEVIVKDRKCIRFEGTFVVEDFDFDREDRKQTIHMTGYVTYLKNENPVWAVACDATDDNRHAVEIDEYAKKCIGSLYEPTQKHIEEDWPGHVFH